jgi:hypothetical protein
MDPSPKGEHREMRINERRSEWNVESHLKVERTAVGRSLHRLVRWLSSHHENYPIPNSASTTFFRPLRNVCHRGRRTMRPTRTTKIQAASSNPIAIEIHCGSDTIFSEPLKAETRSPSNETQDQLPRAHCNLPRSQRVDGNHAQRQSQPCPPLDGFAVVNSRFAASPG